MSLTLNVGNIQRMGSKLARVVLATFDNSYPSGGYKIEPEDVGLEHLEHVQVMDTIVAGGYCVGWDGANNKLKVYYVGSTNSPLAEIPAGTTALNGVDVGLMCIDRV